MDTEIIVAVYVSGDEVLSYEVCKDEEDFQEKACRVKERSAGVIELHKLRDDK